MCAKQPPVESDGEETQCHRQSNDATTM